MRAALILAAAAGVFAAAVLLAGVAAGIAQAMLA